MDNFNATAMNYAIEALDKAERSISGQDHVHYDITHIMEDWNMDFTAALKWGVANLPEGSSIWIPPLPPGQQYVLNYNLIINRRIRLYGMWFRNKSGNQIVGSIIRAGNIDLSKPFIQCANNHSVIDDLAIRGKGKSNIGHVGIEHYMTHGITHRNLFIDGFYWGFRLGYRSAHISAYDLIITDCYDAVCFGEGNWFDYMFVNCLFDGCTRSGAFLVKNQSVENVLFLRCQFGWPAEYGILQDPETTDGNAFSSLSIINSPIEQVKVQHISIVRCGNLRIEGGYWTWSELGSSGTAAVDIKFVDTGPVWLSVKLEERYPNPNAQYVVRVSGSTVHPIFMTGRLPSDFAADWINAEAPVPGRLAFYNGMPYLGNRSVTAGKIRDLMDTTDVRVLARSFPAYLQNMMIIYYVNVKATTRLKLFLRYTPASGPKYGIPGTTVSEDGLYQVRELNFTKSTTWTPGSYTLLQPGEYSFFDFVTADYHQSVEAWAQTDTVDTCYVSCTITPQA